jgi:uncharacterized phage-associated protein
MFKEVLQKLIYFQQGVQLMTEPTALAKDLM